MLVSMETNFNANNTNSELFGGKMWSYGRYAI